MNKKISKYIIFSLLLGVFSVWLRSNAQCTTDDNKEIQEGTSQLTMYSSSRSSWIKTCNDLIIKVTCQEWTITIVGGGKPASVFEACNSQCKDNEISASSDWTCSIWYTKSTNTIWCCMKMTQSNDCKDAIKGCWNIPRGQPLVSADCNPSKCSCFTQSNCSSVNWTESNNQCTVWNISKPICPEKWTCNNACSDKEICDPDTWECTCDPSKWCCWVELNTDVPFIWKCIEMWTSSSTASADGKTTNVNSLNAFPVLMWWLSKIMITVILILSFIAVIAGWVMMTGDGLMWSYSSGKKLIFKVLAWLVLLGASWIILKLINPNFFW